MPTSELSNALNPYANQSRQQNVTIQYESNIQVQYQPVIQQQYQQQQQPHQQHQLQQYPQQHVPHRSELEYAMTQRHAVVDPQTQVAHQRQPTASSVQVVQELLRMVAATRDSQEEERRRRIEWEQQQEIRNAERQAQLERMVTELRQEVAYLRGNNNQPPTQASGSGLHNHTVPTPHNNYYPNHGQPVSPVSPISPPVNGLYTFDQGPDPDLNFTQSYDGGYGGSMGFDMHSIEPPAPSITPSPSPQVTFVEPSMLHSESPDPIPPPVQRSRKRTISALSSEDEQGDDEEESEHSDDSDADSSRPKRQSHHDTRIITINAAMRKHILRMMDITDDRELPASHTEGQTLSADDPVRFVWEKTSRQSVHNSRMKNRILEDIKTNRKTYKHVPDKDFLKKTLESVFEQAFTTLRQKYRAQSDQNAASSQKRRGDAKAQRSRRVSRKKLKLSNRSEARMKLEAFAHVVFDGALQIECMSSEESDQEADPPSNVLRTRGHRWRSTRLIRFYSILDDEERAEKSYKQKRGVGKKDREVGRPKEGFHLPPEGIASWMVSKRWVHECSVQFPDLPEALEKRLDSSHDFDWDLFDTLGNETDISDGEGDNGFEDNYGLTQHPVARNNVGTGSSLDFALVHPS